MKLEDFLKALRPLGSGSMNHLPSYKDTLKEIDERRNKRRNSSETSRSTTMLTTSLSVL